MFSAERMKGSVQITAAGVPCCSILIPSSKLLELQEPQSPTPAKTKSHSFESLSASSSGIGREAVGLLDQSTRFSLKREFKRSETLFKTVSELGLLLSMIPSIACSSEFPRDAVRPLSGEGWEVGL